MTTVKNRYFIAIVPPSPLFDQALEFKNHFKGHYLSKAALNSPPHITLHMPFEWRASKEDGLVVALQKLTFTLTSVKIKFNNFGCFAPRVIFMKVIPSSELTALQYHVRQFFKKELGLFNADYKELPFHPHLTLAFRDLKKPAFIKAWEEFKEKKFQGEFLADRICLLKYDQKWKVMQEFSLSR